MLENLYIKNFVLIDECSLDLKEGFSAFTGETGAGKSVMLDAIALLCGERASVSQIRTGTDKSFIEGTFAVSDDLKREFAELGFEDDLFVITREFDRSGKNVCRLNHRVVTLGLLRDTIGKYVDIHSQNERQYLLDPKHHLELLDTYAKDAEQKAKVKNAYREYAAKRDEYEILVNTTYSDEEADILKYRLNEIDDADLKPGEEEELEERIKVLSSFEKIYDAVTHAINLLDEDAGVTARLHEASRTLSQVRGIEDLEKFSDAFDNLYYEADDRLEQLKRYLSSMEMDETELDRLNTRLYKINALKRKYGRTVEAVLEKRDEYQKQLEAIEHKEDVLLDLEKQVNKAKELYEKEAAVLSGIRKKAAKGLEKDIIREVRELKLQNAVFEVSFVNTAPSANGNDKVLFMISMNPGEPVKPLHKVASGGELSRLMLGLKTVFTSLWGSEVIIFDEIDAGVSGSAARSIGEKMRKISRFAQVFAVTHLSAVAAYADQHYKVEKETRDNETFTSIRILNEEEKIDELAIMNTGSLTETSRKAAMELRESVKHAQ